VRSTNPQPHAGDVAIATASIGDRLFQAARSNSPESAQPHGRVFAMITEQRIGSGTHRQTRGLQYRKWEHTLGDGEERASVLGP